MWENRFGNCGLILFEFCSMGYVSLLPPRPLKDSLRYWLFSCVAICLGMGKKKRKQSWLWEVDLRWNACCHVCRQFMSPAKTYFCATACWGWLNICAKHAVFENTLPAQLLRFVFLSMFGCSTFKQLSILFFCYYELLPFKVNIWSLLSTFILYYRKYLNSMKFDFTSQTMFLFKLKF